MLRVESVEPGSYAAELGLDPGDRIMMINQREIDDLIDYQQALTAETLSLEVLRNDDEVWELEVEKDPDEDFGLQLEHPQPKQCGNNCLFCFVHQLPRGLRHSLYLKDEDYRFSYLYGSYITLSNLREEDYQRILSRKISPLYISIHATDEQVRQQLLGTAAPPILPQIERLSAGGIELHCQIVVCPGINDDQVLKQSINDLAAFYPQVASLAVVPVGLTRHRQKLPDLTQLSVDEARKVLYLVENDQQHFLETLGSRFVFAADELYLQAGAAIPDLSKYEDLTQLENGVGMIALFRQQAAEVLLEVEPLELNRVSLVTGQAFSHELRDFAERLAVRADVELGVVPVSNHFFGTQVTASGLLTGADLLDQLSQKQLGEALLLPDVMLKEGEELLLDDLTVTELEKQLGIPIVVIESSPWGILEGLEQLASGPVSVFHC